MNGPAFNIVSVFISAAKGYPERVALICDEQTISYEALLDEVVATALLLQKKGVKKGDKTMVFLPMSVDLYRYVLALFYLGAVPVFLDEWISIDRLKQCLNVVPCQSFIAPAKWHFAAHFISVLRQIKIKIKTQKVQVYKVVSDVCNTCADDTALITFTTGSTGIPKAADRTHRFLDAQLRALQPLLSLENEASLSTLPIVVLLQLALGKTTVLPPKFYKAKKPETISFMAKALHRHAVQTLITSPSVVVNLIKYGIDKSPHFKELITGGGPVFPDLAADILKSWPEVHSTIVFGSTEAEPISHSNAAFIAATSLETIARLGLPVGKPSAETQVAIIPFNDHPIPNLSINEWIQMSCKPGIAGEIVVSGDHVLKQYINNYTAVARQKINVNNTIWHRTGDAGRMDAQNQIYFLGRCQEVIFLKDRSIFPLMTCYLLKQLLPIEEAALLWKNARLTLILESRKRVAPDLLKTVLAQVNLETAAVIYLKKIPKDPRHQTKIDYEKLLLLLR